VQLQLQQQRQEAACLQQQLAQATAALEAATSKAEAAGAGLAGIRADLAEWAQLRQASAACQQHRDLHLCVQQQQQQQQQQQHQYQQQHQQDVSRLLAEYLCGSTGCSKAAGSAADDGARMAPAPAACAGGAWDSACSGAEQQQQQAPAPLAVAARLREQSAEIIGLQRQVAQLQAQLLDAQDDAAVHAQRCQVLQLQLLAAQKQAHSPAAASQSVCAADAQAHSSPDACWREGLPSATAQQQLQQQQQQQQRRHAQELRQQLAATQQLQQAQRAAAAAAQQLAQAQLREADALVSRLQGDVSRLQSELAEAKSALAAAEHSHSQEVTQLLQQPAARVSQHAGVAAAASNRRQQRSHRWRQQQQQRLDLHTCQPAIHQPHSASESHDDGSCVGEVVGTEHEGSCGNVSDGLRSTTSSSATSSSSSSSSSSSHNAARRRSNSRVVAAAAAAAAGMRGAAGQEQHMHAQRHRQQLDLPQPAAAAGAWPELPSLDASITSSVHAALMGDAAAACAAAAATAAAAAAAAAGVPTAAGGAAATMAPTAAADVGAPQQASSQPGALSLQQLQALLADSSAEQLQYAGSTGAACEPALAAAVAALRADAEQC
jgi:hypothetical protein